MRCHEFQQKLGLLGTHELAPSVRERIEVHLKSCPECRKALARIQQLEDLLTAAPAPPVPDGFALRVVARAKERQATVTRSEPRPLVPLRSAWRRLEFSVGTAVALAAGLMLGLFLGHETWRTTTGQPSAPAAQTSDLLLVASGFDLLGEPRGDSLAEAFYQLTSDHVD